MRDRWRCTYCGKSLRASGLAKLHQRERGQRYPDEITVDHVRAQAGGGGHESQNLVTACRSCNARKRDRPHSRYLTGTGRWVAWRRRQQGLDVGRARELLDRARPPKPGQLRRVPPGWVAL